MNEFKGTPGPWIKREIEGAFHNQKAYAIDFNEDQEQVVDYVYQEEDANLIAVAPQLLLALQDAEEILRGALGAVPGVKSRVDAYANLIAKALGK